MNATAGRRTALALLLAGFTATQAACDTAVEPPPSTTEAVSTTAPRVEAQTSTTSTGDGFDYRAVLVDWGDLFARDDVNTVRGLLESAQGTTMVVDVVEELTGRVAPLGPFEFDISDLRLTSADQMSDVIAQRGGPVWVLVTYTGANFTLHIIELDDTGMRLAAPRDKEPRLGTTNLWLRYGFDSGDFAYEDPDTGRILRFVPGRGQIADFINFAIAAYEASNTGE